MPLEISDLMKDNSTLFSNLPIVIAFLTAVVQLFIAIYKFFTKEYSHSYKKDIEILQWAKKQTENKEFNETADKEIFRNTLLTVEKHNEHNLKHNILALYELLKIVLIFAVIPIIVAYLIIDFHNTYQLKLNSKMIDFIFQFIGSWGSLSFVIYGFYYLFTDNFEIFHNSEVIRNNYKYMKIQKKYFPIDYKKYISKYSKLKYGNKLSEYKYFKSIGKLFFIKNRLQSVRKSINISFIITFLFYAIYTPLYYLGI